jgi:hypothetical protein
VESPTLGFVRQSLSSPSDLTRRKQFRARKNAAVLAVHAQSLAKCGEPRQVTCKPSNPGSGTVIPLDVGPVARAPDWPHVRAEAHVTRRNVGHAPRPHSLFVERPDYVGTDRRVISNQIVITELSSRGKRSGTRNVIHHI